MTTAQQTTTQPHLKQGAYGKVSIHKHSILKQLSFPNEVVSALRLKYFGGGFSTESMLDGVQPLCDTESVSTEDILFAHDMLNKVSRSFAGVIAQLPNTPDVPLRLAIGLFYLVLRALDTVEDDMDLSRFNKFITPADRQIAATNDTAPALEAKQRMLRQFYRYLDAKDPVTYEPITGVGEGDEATVLEGFQAIVRIQFALPANAQRVVVDITKEMGEGMADYIARDLKNGTVDRDDFEQYCHIVAGTVGDGLTRLWAAFDLESNSLCERRNLWNNMGLFLQETNIIRDYLEDLVDGRAFWPKSVWGKYVNTDGQGNAVGLGSLVTSSSEAQRMNCLNEMVADALELVPSCLNYLDELTCPPIIKFCALPQVMAISTLAECYDNPKLFTGVVKIRKGLAAKLVLECCGGTNDPTPQNVAQLRAGYLNCFKHCAKMILAKVRDGDANAERTRKLCRDIVAQTEQRYKIVKADAGNLGNMLFRGNVMAMIMFVAVSAYFFQRNNSDKSTTLPRLSQSFDATLIGIAFVSVAYLLAFAGLPFALKG